MFLMIRFKKSPMAEKTSGENRFRQLGVFKFTYR